MGDAINTEIEISAWLDKFNISMYAQGQSAIKIGIDMNTGLAMMERLIASEA